MTRIKLKYVNSFRDRHGRQRFYFRRPGHKSIALPGLPGSGEFMAAYDSALSGGTTAPKEIGADRAKAGTIAALALSYFHHSTAFKNLGPNTQGERRRILELFAGEHGNKRAALLERVHIQAMVEAKSDTPSAAITFLKAVRGLMEYGVKAGVLMRNPAVGVDRPKIKNRHGHLTWTDDQIAVFEARHPIGSQARLAFALLLYTTQRVSDVVRLGQQHIRDGWIRIRQQKTGTELEIPVLPALKAVLAETPSKHLTFLTSDRGRPYNAKSFTVRFAKWRKQAHLPRGLVPHGLRKASCRIFAEHGATAKEIAAWSGHLSLREVERYTAAADQKKMAAAAARKLAPPEHQDNPNLQTDLQTGVGAGKIP